ncbi:Uncharacterized protein APZ42_003346, partial [Daphnia magna]
ELLQTPVTDLFHILVKQIRIRLVTSLFYRKFVWNCSVLQDLTCYRSVFYLRKLFLILLCFPCLSLVCFYSVKIHSVFLLSNTYVTCMFLLCITE